MLLSFRLEESRLRRLLRDVVGRCWASCSGPLLGHRCGEPVVGHGCGGPVVCWGLAGWNGVDMMW